MECFYSSKKELFAGLFGVGTPNYRMKKALINKFLDMCANPDFSIEEAESIIKQVNINEPFVYSYEIETTFLSEAIENENIKKYGQLLI